MVAMVPADRSGTEEEDDGNQIREGVDQLHAVQYRPGEIPYPITAGAQHPEGQADNHADNHRHQNDPDGLHGEPPVVRPQHPAQEDAGRSPEPDLHVPHQEAQDHEYQQHEGPRDVEQDVVGDQIKQVLEGPLDHIEDKFALHIEPVDALLYPTAEGDFPVVQPLVIPPTGVEPSLGEHPHGLGLLS